MANNLSYLKDEALQGPILANYFWAVNAEGKEFKAPISCQAIAEKIRAIGGGFPEILNHTPFFVDRNDNVILLEDAVSLFGWLQTKGPIAVDWSLGSCLISKSEMHGFLKYDRLNHTSVSKLPHFPAIEDVYYLPYKMAEAGGGYFEDLISRFNPSSNLDRDLIKTAFLTPFWGGPAGARPALFIEAEDGDGRGYGKSALADTICRLSGGGYIDADMKSVDTLTKSIINSMRGHERIVRFDNIKSTRVSSGKLESIITSPMVSGHKMYVGEWSIPNNFTYIFTINDSHLSKDMSQRAVRIKLSKPEYTAEWKKDLNLLLNQHSGEIIAEICHILAQPIKQRSITPFRFSEWQNEVLMRATEDTCPVSEILKRQVDVDDDDEIGGEIGDYILHKISCLANRPNLYDQVCYFITTPVMVTWMKELYGPKMTPRTVARKIKLFCPLVNSTSGRATTYEVVIEPGRAGRGRIRGYFLNKFDACTSYYIVDNLHNVGGTGSFE